MCLRVSDGEYIMAMQTVRGDCCDLSTQSRGFKKHRLGPHLPLRERMLNSEPKSCKRGMKLGGDTINVFWVNE